MEVKDILSMVVASIASQHADSRSRLAQLSAIVLHFQYVMAAGGSLPLQPPPLAAKTEVPHVS